MQYIQNVNSGRCVTIRKDANLSPLFASKCNCNPLQLWKNQDGEVRYLLLTAWLMISCSFVEQHVINELATHGYMDELWGKPGNGEIVGIYDLTGTNWQKWKFQEATVCALQANSQNLIEYSNHLTRMAVTPSQFNKLKNVSAKS